MDRAYEENETRQLTLDLGFIPVVPPTSKRIDPWEYDRAMYSVAMRSGACFAVSGATAESSRVPRSST